MRAFPGHVGNCFSAGVHVVWREEQANAEHRSVRKHRSALSGVSAIRRDQGKKVVNLQLSRNRKAAEGGRRSGRTAGIPVLLLIVLVLVAGCSAADRGGTEVQAEAEPNQASAKLPSIAVIGGVQDVWPFSFGFDASRIVVEKSFGQPTDIETRPAGGVDTTAVVQTWSYPGVIFTFYVDEPTNTDDLLAARIDDPAITLNGGLFLGMPVSDAVALLGEPGHESGDELVYFYYATTIELVTEGDVVSAVVLARAMP